MSLLWIEGFEGTQGQNVQSLMYESLSRYRQFQGGTLNWQTRFGGQCLKSTWNTYYKWVSRLLATTSATMVGGFGLKLAGAPDSSVDVFGFCDSYYYYYSWNMDFGVTLRLTSGSGGTYELAAGVYNASGTWVLLGTTTGAGLCILDPAARNDVWKYVELKVVCNTFTGSTPNADGSLEVRVEGATQLSLTGITTKYKKNSSAHQYHNSFGINNPANGTCFDDIYVLDDTGTAHTDFLGIQHVSTVFPNGPGSSTQWTANSYSGTQPNWQNVSGGRPDPSQWNSLPLNDTALGETDTYGYPTPGRLASVTAVQIVSDLGYWYPPGGSHFYKFRYPAVLGGNEASGPEIILNPYTTSTEYLNPMSNLCSAQTCIVDTDPNGDPWTLTTLAAAFFGIRYSSHT